MIRFLEKDTNYLPFAASNDSPHESNNYNSENSDSVKEDDLQNTYNNLFEEYSELRQLNKQYVKMLNEFEIERNKLIDKVKFLENKLSESKNHLNFFFPMISLIKCCMSKSILLTNLDLALWIIVLLCLLLSV
jgi:hypothetical protein